MLDIEKINEYIPKCHGEHGVDATMHRILLRQSIFHEVFSNPPGGSWTQFDIIKPKTDIIYRWDHMPRVPSEAKRPDLVLQFKNKDMQFLVIESKKSISDIYNNISDLLKNFFMGSEDYIGLKNRPPWHYKNSSESDWKVVKPNVDKKERYWFKLIDDKKITLWTGFAFALKPEYYTEEKLIKKEEWIKKMKTLIKNYDLDVILGISWIDKEHNPVIIKVFSEKFANSLFGKKFSEIIKEWDISPVHIDRF